MVSKKLQNELRKILKDEYSLEIDKGNVAKVADDLMRYFKLVAKINRKNYDNNTSK